MAPETAAAADVHVRVHPADQGPETGNRADFEPKSTRTPASRDARVIPINRGHRQDAPPEEIKAYEPPPAKRPESEFEAAAKLIAEQAAASDFNRQPITPVEAWKTVAPAKGEADNWIIWLGMTLAGLARALIVTTGHVIVRGGDTRIKASVVSSVLVMALVVAYLAGHSA